MKTPTYYKAPLRKRSEIREYLTDGGTHGSYFRNHSRYLFSWNVKIHSYNEEFEHLLSLFEDRSTDNLWIEGCREFYSNMSDNKKNQLWEWTIDSCRESITDCDSYEGLWDSGEGNAEWCFEGRCGGHLCLVGFDGVDLRDDETVLDDMEYKTLCRLYRFVVQCDHDFRAEAVKREFEYQMAFCLFANLCSDIPTREDIEDGWLADQSGEHDFDFMEVSA